MCIRDSSQAVRISGQIDNGSSLPIEVGRVWLELFPGSLSAAPVFDGVSSGPLLVVEAFSTETFELDNIRVNVPLEWDARTERPRLLLEDVSSDPVQFFWDELRSVPALSGSISVRDRR